jgi:hypothetical protein
MTSRYNQMPNNKVGAANSAPRLLFSAFGSLIRLVASGAALMGAVADLARSQ